ncbi:MAG: hypothetical protein ACI9QL_003630 [Candidatus Omnitrophota bacterium]
MFQNMLEHEEMEGYQLVTIAEKFEPPALAGG